jgi:tetratricopeptide (TPR) repeat protein
MILNGIAGWMALRSLGPTPALDKSATLLPHQPGTDRTSAVGPASPPSPPVPPGSTAAAPLAPATVTAEDAKKALYWIAAGADASSRGELLKGIECYTEAVGLEPTNIKALLARALLHSRERVMNWPGAIADATEILRLEPRNAEAFDVRAGAEFRVGDHRRAIEDATEAIRLDPNRTAAYSHRGSAYRELGEWKHAIVDLNEFLNRVPNSSWQLMHRAFSYWSLGDDDRALADINRAVELGPGVTHFRLFRAQVFARKKDYEHAKAELAEAIRISPESEKYYAYQRRGDFELSLGQLEPAIADYTETIQRNSKMAETKDVSGYGARAHAYLARGETDRALADCEEALRINPQATWVRGARGLALARKGNWDRAVADLDEEAKRVPQMKASWLNAKASALALAGRYDQATAAYDEAMKAGGEGYMRGVLSSRGYYFDRPRGNYDEAIKNLNLAEHPVWPPNTYLHRGIIYARLGQPDRALADFKKLMAIAEDQRRDFFAMDDFVSRPLVFLLGRGEAYLLKGDLDRALADADEAVRFLPASAEARLLRARVHDKRGNSDLAAADRRAAAQLVPDLIVAAPSVGSTDPDNPR